jgi:thioredoxin 1
LVSATSQRQSSPSVLVRLGQDDDLQAAIDDASGPVLLDFFADWCGPCRAQGKVLHSVEKAAEETGTLIIKINVDDHPELAKQLKVSSLPTLMMLKNGKVVERKTGLTDDRQLTKWMR